MAYFPNGTSGVVLDNQCLDCIHESEWTFCPVYAVQTMFNYDQCDKRQNKLRTAITMLIDDNGICRVRAAFREALLHEKVGPVPCMEGLKGWADKHKIDVF